MANLLVANRPSIPDKILDYSNETYMADIHTHLPSDDGYTMFVALINITSREIDAVALRNKTSQAVQEAFEEMWRRRYIRSIRGMKFLLTDKDGAFYGAITKQWLFKKGITLVLQNTVEHPNSTAIVERAIGTITRKLKSYISEMTLQNNRQHHSWVDKLAQIVFEINNKARMYGTYTKMIDTMKAPLVNSSIYPLDSIVHRKLNEPVKLLDGTKKWIKFRNGDLRFHRDTNKITGYHVRTARPVRYYLDGNKTISYNHDELKPSAVR